MAFTMKRTQFTLYIAAIGQPNIIQLPNKAKRGFRYRDIFFKAGKRKFDGGHQNQGETKRRYQSSWGNQPLAQQPLSNAYGLAGVNGGAGGYSSSGDQQWYQDTYPSWS